jgi:hypothetical protein
MLSTKEPEIDFDAIRNMTAQPLSAKSKDEIEIGEGGPRGGGPVRSERRRARHDDGDDAEAEPV